MGDRGKELIRQLKQGRRFLEGKGGLYRWDWGRGWVEVEVELTDSEPGQPDPPAADSGDVVSSRVTSRLLEVKAQLDKGLISQRQADDRAAEILEEET